MGSLERAELRAIIDDWASNLEYRVRVYLFGSRLTGASREGSDLDLAIEFLEPMDSDPLAIWKEVDEKWQDYLSHATGLSVDLQLYLGDRTPFLKSRLRDSSEILFESPPG